MVGAAPSAANRLRSDLIRHLGARDILLTDSGTTALRLALEGLRHKRPGATVALPAYGCYDLATAAVGASMPVRFYDVDPWSLSPDVDSLRGAIRAGAEVVVVAHLYGIPVDLDAVREVAREGGASVVEDAAQAVGAWIEERRAGSAGSLAVLSFGRGKGLGGSGGGALVANDVDGERALTGVLDRLGRGCRGGAALAQACGQWLLARPSLYGLPASVPFLRLGETVYRSPHPPGPIAPASAGIVSRMMHGIDGAAEVRRRHAARLLASSHRSTRFRPVDPPSGSRPGWLRLPVLATAERSNVSTRARRLGIEPGYPTPLDALPALTALVVGRGGGWPGAETLARRLITLPTHDRLSSGDLLRLEAWLAA